MEEEQKYTREEVFAALDRLEEAKKSNKKEDAGCLACIGMLTIMFFNVVVYTVLQGYIFISAWGWFVVPLGVSAIGFWHAYGIAMTVKLFSRGMGKAEKSKANTMADVYKFMGEFALQTVGLLLVWLVLYATHCMM